MKFNVLSSISITLALVASASGCAKKASAGDCDAVGAHIVELTAKRTLTPDEAEAVKDPALAAVVTNFGQKNADVFKTRCKADGWLKESSDCVVKADTLQSAMLCKVTEEQNKKLGAEVNAMTTELNAEVAKVQAASAAAAAAAAGTMAGSAADMAGSAAAEGSANAGSAVEAAGSAAAAADDAVDEAGSAGSAHTE